MRIFYLLVFGGIIITNNIIAQTTDLNLPKNIEKKSLILGVDIGLNYQRSENQFLYSNTSNSKSTTTSSTISFSPTAGYFITKWLMTGLEIEYISSNSKTQFNQEIDYYAPHKTIFKTGLFSPVFRFYFYKGLYTQLDFSYGFTQYNVEYKNLPEGSTDLSEDVKKEVYGGSIGLGYSLIINQNIIIEPKFNYKKLKYKGEHIIDTDNLIFKIGLKILL